MHRASSLALLLALGVVSCAHPPRDQARPEPAASPSVAPSTSASAEAEREAVRAFLARFGVDDAAPARRVLYTWTTAPQIDEIDRGAVLLTRTSSPTYGPSGFDRVVAERPPSDALARLLRNSAYAKKRFAWPAPWATVAGLAGGSYGDRLVRIELADDAIVLRHVASTGAWDGFDLRGSHVDEATILAHPERLAAVYFVSDVTEPGRPAFREYVIVNESRIASWSYGDEADERLLIDAAAMLERLPGAPHEDFDAWSRARVLDWRGAPGGDVYAAWSSTLAFATPDYVPERAPLDRIVRKLRAAPRTTPPKTHRPTASFALIPGPPPPLPPGKRSRGYAT